MKRGRAAAMIAALCVGAVACAGGPVMRGRIRGLQATVADAEKNGAMRCAPRELALAKAHLKFASVDLDQGQMGQAENHMAIAEPNARAALEMSPGDRCSSRDFVEIVAKPRPGDRDGDGYRDPDDKCPDKPENYNGFEDDDGCPDDPDTDGDGITDSSDHCILEPEDKDGYLDDDGCPDLDNDGDGIPDDKDKCKNQPEDFDGFEDDDGCPDPDNDKDEVADVNDMCPNTPGFNGGDKPGCPKRMNSVVVTTKEIRITQQIQFAPGSWIILPVSFKILNEVVEVLKDNPKITLEVQGHTDDVGPAAYNKNLSQQRADSVVKYIVKAGIAQNRLVPKGYGMERPLVPNVNAANRAINRRVQFVRTESGTAPTTTP
jgi:outer membrane protein OmpA-like peptidoglycan-associated protein